MSSYRFGKSSLERLESCDQRLQQIMKLAIQRSPIDFGIAEGHRSVERQQELFKAKPPKTKVDGIKIKSKHNHYPSLAVDIYGFVNGKATWDASSLVLIAGVVFACASELGLRIRWGGNWDQDGEIITDQKFQDFPHFELG